MNLYFRAYWEYNIWELPYTYQRIPLSLNNTPRIFTQIMKKCMMVIKEIL
jgi:hypothetical protein